VSSRHAAYYLTRTAPTIATTSIPPSTDPSPLRTVAQVGQVVREVLRANGNITADLLEPLEDSPNDFHVEIENASSIIPVVSFVEQELIEQLHRNPSLLKSIDRRRLEEIVAEIFDGLGYAVELTKRTRDGGKDVIAIKRAEVNVRFLIDCKRPDPGNPVRLGAVRELHSVKVSEGATKGILATTTYFTRDAKIFIEQHPWELEGRDFEAIREWVAQYLRSKGKLG
jgi:restriction endonuclease Mrr